MSKRCLTYERTPVATATRPEYFVRAAVEGVGLGLVWRDGSGPHAWRARGSGFRTRERAGLALYYTWLDTVERRAEEERKALAYERASEPETCKWFLKCGAPAVGVTPHPVLGNVPTCARCHEFATRDDK